MLTKMKRFINIKIQMNLKEINFMKKFLAISALSLGFLSSAPLALCAPGSANSANNTNNVNNVNGQPRRWLGYDKLMMAAFYLNSTDFTNLLLASKTNRCIGESFKINPAGIYSLQDVKILVPNIETFEDYHQLTPGEDRNNHVNELLQPIRTLIYYPGSFDAERFYNILEINGIEKDFENIINKTVEIDPISNRKTVRLCGDKWECVIKPSNGRDYRVEYIKKIEADEKTNKKIIFIFSPSPLINTENRDFIKNFNDLVKCCGLRDFINVERTLKTFVIPTGVTSIVNSAFLGCKALEKIEIPNSVTEIGGDAFFGCKALKEIEIPNSVTSIGRFAFCDCESLKEIKISNNVTSINSRVFFGCKALKEIEIPNSVTAIGDDAFALCKSLKEIKIPNSVTSIGQNAFYGCTSLKEIEIPNSVTSIGDGAFNGCTSLKEIKWNDHTYGVEEFLEAFKNRL